MKKKEIIIVGIIIGVFLVGQLFFIEVLEKGREQERNQIFEEGYQVGLNDAVVVLFNNLEECNIATIWAGNFSKQIVDVSCINP